MCEQNNANQKWYGFIHPYGTTYFDNTANDKLITGGNKVTIKHVIMDGPNKGKKRSFSIDKKNQTVFDFATKHQYKLAIVDTAEHLSVVYGFKHAGGEAFYPEEIQDEFLKMTPDKDGLVYVSYCVLHGKNAGKNHVHAINMSTGEIFNKSNNNRYSLIKKTGIKCEDCNHIKDDVDLKIDPFAHEMSDMNIPMFLCDSCAEERWLDT